MAHEKDIDAADWTDQDLLTRDEAGERLDDEIETTRNRLTELKSQSGEVTNHASALDMVTRRLAAMETLRVSL
jgi:hypothetical protein